MIYFAFVTDFGTWSNQSIYFSFWLCLRRNE